MKLQSVCLRPAPPCTSEFTLNLLMQFRFRVEQELLGIFICKVSACNALAPFTPGIKMFKGLSQMTPKRHHLRMLTFNAHTVMLKCASKAAQPAYILYMPLALFLKHLKLIAVSENLCMGIFTCKPVRFICSFKKG